MSSSEHFYRDLPPFSAFAHFPEAQHYQPLPSDWLIAISDVRGSTAAIEAGRYKEVNALGVATIVALLNALRPLEVPYVFGGDGATACLPATARPQAERALRAARHLARTQFDLELRVGLVPMTEVQAAAGEVRVARYRPHPFYSQAMFLGDGLGYCERLIKDPRPHNPYLLQDAPAPLEGRFEGFECRWNQVPSPHGETISLLVQALGSAPEAVYRAVLAEIDSIYGDEARHHPLREEALHLAQSGRALRTETRIRGAGTPLWQRLLYHARLQLLILMGRWLMRRGAITENGDWGGYKSRLIANSDYRKFDELLRMVISGTPQQRHQLRDALEARRARGELVFGLHAAKEALITCVIQDYHQDHVHFLDAADGGYALAAKELKGQLKGRQQAD